MKTPAFVLVLSGWVAAATAVGAGADPQQQIATLRREIAHHDALYHQEAAPEISDYDYDLLKRKLSALEREFPAAAQATPPLAGIGDDRSGIFPPYQHRERMLSLDKTYTEAEVRSFQARVAKTLGATEPLEWVVEPKFDGIAVNVVFEDGRLVHAATRGNGIEGDDITSLARQIVNLPETLAAESPDGARNPIPARIELRGEIFVPFADFARVNAEREAAGETAFANPRNLAAGTMRQREAPEVARRGIRVVFYGIGACEPAALQPPTQRDLHRAIAAWGLPGVTDLWTARGADEVWRAIENVQVARAGFAFPTDGAVVKLDRVALQRELGASDSAPRWMIAYKFPPERAETQLRGITWQVGRTGVLTPVAELAPVALAGSTISRATLHNADEITRRDLRLGDTVYVEKAGEIIPAIVGVNPERRPANAEPYALPRACPVCGSDIARRKDDVALRCANLGCAGRLCRRIEHFASKTCLDIEGLSPALIDDVVARGLVKDVPDLFRLRAEDFAGRRIGERVVASLERSKRTELWRVIFGLGLPQIGAAAAREQARRFGTLEAFAAAEIVDARTRGLIGELIACGVKPPPVAARANANLAGKNFVLTGTLPTLQRAEAVAKIQNAGGKVTTNVSRNTHYVVAGAEPGAKLTQARSLGVAVIDETELRRMLDEP